MSRTRRMLRGCRPRAIARGARHRSLAWADGQPTIGMISDIAGRPEVHPHWLFLFAVPSLDAAVARVRSLGGIAIGPTALPNGARVAVCDDPQGAAFGLIEPR